MQSTGPATSVINPDLQPRRRGATFPPMYSLNIDTSMHGCNCNSPERERGNFEVDQLHSAVLTNARLVAAAIADCDEEGNWLIHATLSSQTNLVTRCLINLTPRCVRSERFASLASAHFALPYNRCYHGRFVLFSVFLLFLLFALQSSKGYVK